MKMYITTKGLNRVHRFSKAIGPALEHHFDSGLNDFAKNLQAKAKRRAPRDTGFLASQIKLIKTKKLNLSITTGEAYYAFAQEFGYSGHWIPNAYFNRHRTAPGVPGGAMGRIETRRFSFVSKHTPFIRPALDASIPRLKPIILSQIKKAVKKAGR